MQYQGARCHDQQLDYQGQQRRHLLTQNLGHLALEYRCVGDVLDVFEPACEPHVDGMNVALGQVRVVVLELAGQALDEVHAVVDIAVDEVDDLPADPRVRRACLLVHLALHVAADGAARNDHWPSRGLPLQPIGERRQPLVVVLEGERPSHFPRLQSDS